MLKRLLLAHFVLACLYAAILFVIVYASAFQVLGHNLQNRPRQWDTYGILGRATDAVQEYQKAHKKLPPALSEKEISKRLEFLNNFDPKVGPADGWGRPLHYEVKGDKFKIVSFGRDGLPGGVGLNADIGAPTEHGPFLLSNMPNVGPLQPPTFEQFWTIRDSQEIVGNSVAMWGTICCVFVFGLMFLASRHLWVIGLRRLARGSIGRVVWFSPRGEVAEQVDDELISQYALVFSVLDPEASLKARILSALGVLASAFVMVVFSLFFAGFITLVHIRSGH